MSRNLSGIEIMAEHAKFIRGLLDPTEEALFQTLIILAENLMRLTAEALAAHTQINLRPRLPGKASRRPRR